MNNEREFLSGSNPSGAEEGGSRPVIVVVDDETMVGEIIAAVLQMEGYKTHLFTAPGEALRYMAGGTIKPDLLIVDYAMTPLNGLELIERAREILPGVPSILCSGAMEDILARSETQPEAFLSKPFLPREMLQAVAAILDVAAKGGEEMEPGISGAAVLSN